MQTVSFETAKRLKEAGFPLPDDNEELVLWGNKDGFVEHMPTCEATDSEEELEWFYTPTATDVLPEDWLLMRDVEGWICQYRADFGIYVTHENPAEAAAAAWFWENDRK